MTELRRKYWIPKLPELTKRLRYTCKCCKRFQATAFKVLVSRLLPKDKMIGSRPFKFIWTSYNSPVLY